MSTPYVVSLQWPGQHVAQKSFSGVNETTVDEAIVILHPSLFEGITNGSAANQRLSNKIYVRSIVVTAYVYRVQATTSRFQTCSVARTLVVRDLAPTGSSSSVAVGDVMDTSLSSVYGFAQPPLPSYRFKVEYDVWSPLNSTAGGLDGGRNCSRVANLAPIEINVERMVEFDNSGNVINLNYLMLGAGGQTGASGNNNEVRFHNVYTVYFDDVSG